MPHLPWFRLYTEIRDDAKLRDFTAEEFRLWIYLLCLAGEEGRSGEVTLSVDAIAWKLRYDVQVVALFLDKCAARSMVTTGHESVTIVNFSNRQYGFASERPDATRARKRRSRSVTAKSRRYTDTEDIQNITDTEKRTASAAVENPTTPAALPISEPAVWPPDLVEVHASLLRLEAPEDLHDPGYWRTVVEAWVDHPGVAILPELAKYLNNERGKNGRRQHKNHRSGFSNWLRTAERIADRDSQKSRQFSERR